MTSRLDPSWPADIPWIAAKNAYALGPHPPLPMQPLCLKGPIKEWVCPECSRYGEPRTLYSLTTEPPICQGGLEYLK